MQSNTSGACSGRSLVVFTVLGIVCFIGVTVCVVVLVSSSTGEAKRSSEKRMETNLKSSAPQKDLDFDKDASYVPSTSGANLPQGRKFLKRLSRKLVRNTRSASVKNLRLSGEDLASCTSSYSNDTIPAAHVCGHGILPFEKSTSQSSIIRKGFQQKWRCNGYMGRHGFHAFVDGGMKFNQTEKSLVVPVCGYYHIASQILFEIKDDTITTPRRIYHSLKFKSNCTCPSSARRCATEQGVQGQNMITVNGAKATTHTSDVVHLCAGGKVWVEIPDGRNRNPCCPMGDEEGTFIAAYLISQTSCKWPRKIISELMR